jgi:hypothetical protein
MPKKSAVRRPVTLRLHGVRVPAADYAQLKRLAEVFFAETPSDLPQREARKVAVEYAVQVLGDWRHG